MEIGVIEGRSAIWMLENILTHPTAKLTGIDILPKGLNWKEIYLFNLDLSGSANKALIIEGASQIELRKLTLNSFDIIYIDACHGIIELTHPGGCLGQSAVELGSSGRCRRQLLPDLLDAHEQRLEIGLRNGRVESPGQGIVRT